MKVYESDGSLNYDDLSGRGVGEVKGCGPCPDIWNESDSAHKFDSGFEVLSASTKGRAEKGADKGAYASAGADFSGFRYRDNFGDLKLGNYSASAEAGVGPNGASVKYKLGVDVVSVKVGGTKVNVGVDASSGVAIGEGSAKLKVGGLGVSVGKEIGVSTPFGGVSINLEETAEKCSIQ
ncbi:MAG: hypothetical protein MRERV_27c032 [Mycoplasmataceae bacterium RV_VA103A]|nr:MAG: hypothetical protein MRERV_27c032 [Mycoplasmataceae bacterium RV_VA103A]